MTSEHQRWPLWSDELKARYLAGEASAFLLHGNIRDLFWFPEQGGGQWLDLPSFLRRFFLRSKDLVGTYNLSQGLSFENKGQEKAFKLAVNAQRVLNGEASLAELPRFPNEAVPVIEQLITSSAQRSAIIMDFFETVAPRGDLSFMSVEDRANLVAMQRWSTDPAFLATDNVVVLLTEHLSDVSPRVVASPQLKTLRVPFPEEETRLFFLKVEGAKDVPSELTPAALATATAGLTLLQIRSLLRGARQSGSAITFREVSARKKAIIEQVCHGLVEFVDPRHNFSHVGGMERIKNDLLSVARAVREGLTSAVPMGIIFVGPMGTGKTFVGEAFASESGLTCLKFKNFRDRWVGSTEGNLEKVLDLVDALGFVLLIIDEAERSLSSGDRDGGTNSRVIARLKEFMSDTSHRGRVVMLMMTNRPDKLDADLKRPGRFDLKMPFFFPEAADERTLILQALARKNDVVLSNEVELAAVAEKTEGYSGAELEALLLRAARLAVEATCDEIGSTHLDAALEDLIPSRDTRMLEYMELLAVFESSSKRLLPPRFQEMSADAVHERLDALRIQLGRRVL